MLPVLTRAGRARGAGARARLLGRLGLRTPAPTSRGIARGLASLERRRDARRAFLHTARSIIDPSGQRVGATDRLYLAEGMPTLIVWGERDPMIPVAHGIAAHALIPHSRLEVFPGAGHYPFDEDPERFAARAARLHRGQPGGRRLRRGEPRGGCCARGRRRREPAGGADPEAARRLARVGDVVRGRRLRRARDLRAHGARARGARCVYGIGLCALFAASGLYHRWRWNPRWRPLLRRIDHSHDLRLHRRELHAGRAARAVAARSRWSCSRASGWARSAGVALSVAWITAPRALVRRHATSRSAGSRSSRCRRCSSSSASAPFVLFAAGGLLYTVGAVVYAFRRPNPWPRTFGFHEVFHALVIAAAAVHFVAIAGWVIPAG